MVPHRIRSSRYCITSLQLAPNVKLSPKRKILRLLPSGRVLRARSLQTCANTSINGLCSYRLIFLIFERLHEIRITLPVRIQEKHQYLPSRNAPILKKLGRLRGPLFILGWHGGDVRLERCRPLGSVFQIGLPLRARIRGSETLWLLRDRPTARAASLSNACTPITWGHRLAV